MTGVQLEINDHVAVVTLDDPKTRNALTAESSRDLIDICEEIDRQQHVGAAVLRGANATFCSGAAREVLGRAAEDPAESSRYDEVGVVYDAFVRFGNLAVPTVAAARGSCVGAGVNLLLSCDLRIVATDVRILSGFQKIGIHPGGGHLTLLHRLVNREAVAAAVLFSEEISGERAREIGLAWEAVADDEVEDRAMELAVRAAADPSLARRVLSTMRTELGPPAVSWAAAVEMERAAQMWSLRRRHEAQRHADH